MKLLGFTLSALLHLLIIAAGAWLFEFTPPPGALQKIIEIKLAEPEPKQLPMPVPEPVEKRSAREQRRHKIYDVLAQAALPHESLQPVKVISSRKVDVPEGDVMLVKNQIYFGSNMLKQGNEVRLTLRGIRAMDFGVEDFLGSYKVSGEDRVVSVQRLEDGRLLFTDSKTGMRRVLRKKGKFIYTYGPDLEEQDPVQGSVTFFPHDHDGIELPSRIMWLPDEPPMKMGVMEEWPDMPWQMEGQAGSLGAVK